MAGQKYLVKAGLNGTLILENGELLENLFVRFDNVAAGTLTGQSTTA